ncbi:hypothetical protein AFUB_060380 [Aspergillus fumigatus A1163]|uniref:ABC transmembrane type-1 domain-containing protein n=1 Tax=Aspergillus fumigatus (strain CBS 144.89 / FGSC A1163 / CEA10) TaxID=451804 RepID=B0Y1P9_ASPFC|nr:hypothetical protein AFUB_060380 [Aspergillus fumigatus A1163]
MLPLVAINTADSAGSCLVKLGILCAVSSYAALTAPFFILALWVLQRFYLHTSRQVRLRDIEAKAPLYSHLLETIDGLATIRAFRWTTDFETKNDRLTTRSQIPIYTLYCVQQWLQVVLDMMVAVLVVILIAVFVFWPGMYTPGSVGVALNIVITFSTGLASLIKNWTMMETSIGAERWPPGSELRFPADSSRHQARHLRPLRQRQVLAHPLLPATLRHPARHHHRRRDPPRDPGPGESPDPLRHRPPNTLLHAGIHPPQSRPAQHRLRRRYYPHPASYGPLGAGPRAGRPHRRTQGHGLVCGRAAVTLPGACAAP